MKHAIALTTIVWITFTSQAANQVVAWGASQYGVLNVPANLTNAVAIAAGNYHSMALRSDGTVAVWGDRSYGQTNVPAGLSNVVAIAAYGDQCLALKSDGKVVGWGTPATPVPVANALSNIVSVAGRNDANLALTADGIVKMWTTAFGVVPSAAQSNVVALSGGDKQGLVLKDDGRVVGWGTWDRGYSGSVTVTVPTNLTEVIALGAGNCQCVGLKTDGTLYSWGVNHYGGETNLPAGLTNVAAIAIAHNHSLALRENGAVAGWGYDSPAGVAKVPSGLTNVIMIAAGYGHNLALVNDGSPAITLQPRPQRVYEGTSATFIALAAGAPPLSYQWQCNGTNVPDATSKTLVLLDRQVGPVENYSLVVSNAVGTTVSQPATLTVMPGQITITGQPVGRTNNAGVNTTFTVTAAGAPPLQYQWRKDGVDLGNGGRVTNAQTAALTLKTLMRSDAGDYSVFITNAYGGATSQVARLEVIDPAINWQPYNQDAYAGYTVVMNVTAGGTPPLAYQWFHGGTPMADGGGVLGASSNSLTLTYVLRANQGDYWVAVTNLYGAVTSQVATLTVADPVIYNPPLSQVANAGDAATFTVNAAGTPPMIYQWRKNGANISGATGSALTLPNVQTVDGGLYDVIVTNAFGALTTEQARLTVNLALPDTFWPAANDGVSILALQPDGKILVSGFFTNLAGQARNYLGRLNSNGSLDTVFDPSPQSPPSCLAVQSDGKILVAGDFTMIAGVSCNRLARLNTDGTYDWSFVPEAYGVIYSMAVAADGRVLLGGTLASLDGTWSASVVRLSATGALDRTLAPMANDYVYCVALQPDGKVLVGGNFSYLNDQNRPYLARLLPNGTVDTSFNPVLSGSVSSLVVQPDGKILVGGVGRLLSNGAVDSSFNAANGFASAMGMALQADGKIVLGGTLSGLAGAGLGRVYPNGNVDLSFDPGGPCVVTIVAIQPDGRIVLGGWFTELAGQPCTNLGRLFNTDPATSDLVWDGTQLTWLRGGASPEVWRTTFEYSLNLVNWVSLGAGTRIAGGWRVVPVSLPTNCTIRARGFVANATASWLVENRLVLSDVPPTILVQDGLFGVRTNAFGFSFAGVPGQRVVVQCSTDLRNWVPLSTNLLSDTPSYFSDPATATYPARFYRLGVGP